MVLNALGESAMGSVAFFEAALRSGYGASAPKLHKKTYKILARNEKIISDFLITRQLKRNFSKLVYQLEKDGLVNKRDTSVKITKKGMTRRGQLEMRLKTAMPDHTYNSAPSESVTIITYDIPEKMRRERNWLREALAILGLAMVHRSVFVGKKKIPKSFLDNLKALRILEYVHIFEVSKAGSLKNMR